MAEHVRILCVDDEKNVLRSLQRLFLDEEYEIIIASSGKEGLEILHNSHPVQIVISDYRMPEMTGVEFLKEVCSLWPDTIRIVLSGYADTTSVVGAINEGQIYKFIPKPWNDDELKVTVSNAIERYNLHKKNQQLTYDLQKSNEELHKLNENLEKVVEKRTSELLLRNQILTHSRNILDALPVAVIGIDMNGLIVLSNNKCNDLFTASYGIIGMDRMTSLPENINSFIERVITNRNLAESVMINEHAIYAKGALMSHADGQEGVVLVFDPEVQVG